MSAPCPQPGGTNPIDWHPGNVWLQVLGYWQTLIAGFLAVGAAVATIRATVRSANRELEAAYRQIETAQRQVEIALLLDRRRNMQETQAFLVAPESATSVVIDSVKASKAMVPIAQARDLASQPDQSMTVYRARKRVQCPQLQDLRSACVRIGSDLTASFFLLDQNILAFAANWRPGQTQGMPFRRGIAEGFQDDLSEIEKQAQTLRDVRRIRQEQCDAELRALDHAVAGLSTQRPQ